MIAEDKKQAVITAIRQMEDEVAFDKIAALVTAILGESPGAPRNKFGFMQGSVTYLVADWDAPLPDSDWDAFK